MDHTEVLVNKENLIKNFIIRPTKFNRTTKIVSGSFEIVRPFDDSYSLEWKLSTMSANEYKVDLEPQRIEKLCQYLSETEIIFPGFVASSNLPPLPPLTQIWCPLPQGIYKINEYIVHEDDIPITLPGINTNGETKRRLNVTIFHENDVEAQFTVYALFRRNSFV